MASTDEGYISKAVFSPDGSFVAYEVMPTWGAVDSGVSRVFVAPVQGGDSHLVYESKRWESSYQFTSLIDWTANGRYLIIRDTQFGKSALFLLPMMDGAATGIAEIRIGAMGEGDRGISDHGHGAGGALAAGTAPASW